MQVYVDLAHFPLVRRHRTLVKLIENVYLDVHSRKTIVERMLKKILSAYRKSFLEEIIHVVSVFKLQGHEHEKICNSKSH